MKQQRPTTKGRKTRNPEKGKNRRQTQNEGVLGLSHYSSTPMLHETKPLIAQKPVISQQRAVTSRTGTEQQKNSEFWCSDQGLWKKRGFKFSLLYYVNSDIEEAKAKAERSGEQEAL
jgi:hypothetical protein